MIEVKFFTANEIEDGKIKFAVIMAKHQEKWIYCRHSARSTFEIPGGHREAGESVLQTAKRELYEETGATEFDIAEVCIYAVCRDAVEPSYGALYFADVKALGSIPESSEIGEIALFEGLPDSLTYPAIQPELYKKALKFIQSISWR